jgi:Zn-finger protein
MSISSWLVQIPEIIPKKNGILEDSDCMWVCKDNIIKLIMEFSPVIKIVVKKSLENSKQLLNQNCLKRAAAEHFPKFH